MKKIAGMIAIFFLMGCTNGESMDLEGKITMKGSSPHSYLSIYDKKTKRSYKIKNRETFNLMIHQNKSVKLEAKLLKNAIGPGFPATIEVIEIKED